MVKDAASVGFYESATKKKFARVQLLTIDGLLDGTQRAEHPDYEPDFNRATPSPFGLPIYVTTCQSVPFSFSLGLMSELIFSTHDEHFYVFLGFLVIAAVVTGFIFRSFALVCFRVAVAITALALALPYASIPLLSLSRWVVIVPFLYAGVCIATCFTRLPPRWLGAAGYVFIASFGVWFAQHESQVRGFYTLYAPFGFLLLFLLWTGMYEYRVADTKA